MKKIIIIFSCLFLVSIIGSAAFSQVSTQGKSNNGTISPSPGPPVVIVNQKPLYKTFTVTRVTRSTLTLTAKYRGKKITKIIKKSRRPYLKAGDRVRYDNVRNRLGKTLARK